MNLTHLHPMMVHFPIALAFVALLLNLCTYFCSKQEWLRPATTWLTLLAALGTLVSVATGYFFTNPVAGLAASVKHTHVLWAWITTALLVLASVYAWKAIGKKQTSAPQRYILTVLLLISSISVGITGMKGGTIVYDIWLFGM